MSRPIISTQQRYAGGRQRRAETVVRIASELRKQLPAHYLPSEDRELASRIHFALEAAKEFGLERKDLTSKWIFLSATIAPYFWTDPPSKAYLQDGDPSPDIRFQDYYARLYAAHAHRDSTIKLPSR